MNINGIGPLSHLSSAAIAHRSQKAAGSQSGLEQPNPAKNAPGNVGGSAPEGAGKANQSPAFVARARIAVDPTLGEGPFGRLVSEIAKARPPEAPTDPVEEPDTTTPDAGAGAATGTDITV